MEKLYTVIETANKLNVTRQCIYSKLTTLKKDLKGNVVIKKNIKYLNEEAIKIIKETLKDPGIKENKNTGMEMLKDQLKIKDEQLKTKDEQLKNKDKLIENMQILLKKEQENVYVLNENLNKNLLLLENNKTKTKKSIFSFWRKN